MIREYIAVGILPVYWHYKKKYTYIVFIGSLNERIENLIGMKYEYTEICILEEENNNLV